MFHSLIAKSSLVVDSTNSWWIDSKATDHIYNSLHEFQIRRRLDKRNIYPTLTFDVIIVMQAMGDVTLVLENNFYLELKDCLFVPQSRKNLVWISSSNKCIYLVYFNKSIFIKKNNSFIFLDPLVDNLYHTIPSYILPCVENSHISLKRKVPRTNQMYLWHLSLGHINLNRI